MTTTLSPAEHAGLIRAAEILTAADPRVTVPDDPIVRDGLDSTVAGLTGGIILNMDVDGVPIGVHLWISD